MPQISEAVKEMRGIIMFKRRIKKCFAGLMYGAVVALGLMMISCDSNYVANFDGAVKPLETDDGLVSEEYVYFDGDEPTYIDECDLLNYYHIYMKQDGKNHIIYWEGNTYKTVYILDAYGEHIGVEEYNNYGSSWELERYAIEIEDGDVYYID